ncbi:MAG: type II toxin-antitoxin system RelE/ParE family toxin [Acidobacteriota bacterium]
MSTRVVVTARCADQVKTFGRQYNDFSATFEQLCATLEKSPTAGIPLGKKVYKQRLPMAGKGKSGGFRVIYHYDPERHYHADSDGGTLTLLLFFRKSDQDTIEPKEIAELLKRASLG